MQILALRDAKTIASKTLGLVGYALTLGTGAGTPAATDTPDTDGPHRQPQTDKRQGASTRDTFPAAHRARKVIAKHASHISPILESRSSKHRLQPAPETHTIVWKPAGNTPSVTRAHSNVIRLSSRYNSKKREIQAQDSRVVQRKTRFV